VAAQVITNYQPAERERAREHIKGTSKSKREIYKVKRLNAVAFL
jgi:hypothetical protein